jgi:DNA-binding FrmR family transcriptional regulator
MITGQVSRFDTYHNCGRLTRPGELVQTAEGIEKPMPRLSGNEQQLIHRISGIEGHVRSLKKMIGEDREPLEILMQISSIQAAIVRLSHVIFEEFVEGALHGIQTEEERTAAIADIRAALETLR